MENPPNQTIDARGLSCPLPVLKAQKRLKSMQAGHILEVLADDPRAPEDFRQFAEVSGHRLISLQHHNDGMRVQLARRA